MKSSVSLKEFYKRFPKDEVFEKYSRIVKQWKEYDNITRTKMLDAIIEEYSDFNNIIDICTLKELKYLEMLVNQDENIHNKKDYTFEIKNLIDKMLILPITMIIPSELLEPIKLAIQKYDKNVVTDKDKINEILVGAIKIYGEIPAQILIEITKPLITCSPNTLANHIENNKLFHYYVMPSEKEIGFSEEKILTFIYNDYFDYIEDLDYQRMNNAIAYDLEFDVSTYKNMYQNTFYHNFDINNKKISKMIELLKNNLQYEYDFILRDIQICALLYESPEEIINMIKRALLFNKSSLKKDLNVEEIIKQALNEIPSGALNGLTPQEYLTIKEKITYKQIEKEKRYTPQINACLSKKEADLFYKLYFALLEYTNNQYHINTHIKKIYKQQGINPAYLVDITDRLWKEPDKIIDNFIKENPYRFNQEELSIVKDFKLGQRDIYFLANYETEYTSVVSKEEKTYMIKGIRDNLDNIIDYEKLPTPVITTLLPFNGKIIYDGIINELPISLGQSFNDMIEDSLNKNIKYYHL